MIGRGTRFRTQGSSTAFDQAAAPAGEGHRLLYQASLPDSWMLPFVVHIIEIGLVVSDNCFDLIAVYTSVSAHIYQPRPVRSPLANNTNTQNIPDRNLSK